MRQIQPFDLKMAQELVLEARSLVVDVQNLLEATANLNGDNDESPTRQQIVTLEEVLLKINAAYGCLIWHQISARIDD